MSEPIKVQIDLSAPEKTRVGSGGGKTNEEKRQEAEARKAADKARRQAEQAERMKRWDERRAAREASTIERQQNLAAFRLRLAGQIKQDNQIAREERAAKRKALRDAANADKADAARKIAALDNAFLGLAGRVGLGSTAGAFANMVQANGSATNQGGPKTPLAMNLPLPSSIRTKMGLANPPIPGQANNGPQAPPIQYGPPRPPGFVIGGSRWTPPTPPGPPPNKIPPIPNPPGGGSGGGKNPFSTVNLAKVFFVLEIIKTLGQVAVTVTNALKGMIDRLNTTTENLAKYNGVIAGAEANRRVALLQENLRQGAQLQQPTVEYIQSRSELQLAYARTQAEILQAILPIGQAINEGLSDYVKPLVLALNAYNASGYQDFYSKFSELARYIQMAGNQSAFIQEAMKIGIDKIYDWLYDSKDDDKDLFKSVAEFLGADTKAIEKNVANLPVYTGP